MSDITQLSEPELAEVIAQASQALEKRRAQARRETIAQIRALTSSIGAGVVIKEQPTEERPLKGNKAPVTFRYPDNPYNAWSGRGVKPKWLQAYSIKHARSTNSGPDAVEPAR